MPPKLSQENAKKYFENLGFKLLSEYANTTSKVLLLCGEGHTFESTYKQMTKSPVCPKCKEEKFLKEVEDTVHDRGFEMMSKYINSCTPMDVKCKKGHIVPMTYDNIKQGNGCKVCSRRTMPSYMHIKDFITKHGYMLLSKNIESATIKFDVMCPKGHIYSVSWNKFSSGRRCPHCQNKVKLTLSDARKIFEVEEYEVIGEYIDTITPVLVRCPKGHEYPVTVGNFKSGKRCRRCGINSKGELKICEILNSLDEEYKTQHKFNGCVKIFELPFDFYLPDYNMCIEYDGVQHFEPVDFAGKGKDWAEKNLKETKKRDKIKNIYCKENNIELIRIPYWDFDKIEEILDQTITNLKQPSTTIP